MQINETFGELWLDRLNSLTGADAAEERKTAITEEDLQEEYALLLAKDAEDYPEKLIPLTQERLDRARALLKDVDLSNETYTFDLRFALGYPDEDPAKYVEPFHKNCRDAGIGVGKKGAIAFMFSREAFSAQDAIASAIEDVLEIIPTATLLEVKYKAEESQ